MSKKVPKTFWALPKCDLGTAQMQTRNTIQKIQENSENDRRTLGMHGIRVKTNKRTKKNMCTFGHCPNVKMPKTKK
jgi:hypothetical protein